MLLFIAACQLLEPPFHPDAGVWLAQDDVRWSDACADDVVMEQWVGRRDPPALGPPSADCRADGRQFSCTTDELTVDGVYTSRSSASLALSLETSTCSATAEVDAAAAWRFDEVEDLSECPATLPDTADLSCDRQMTVTFENDYGDTLGFFTSTGDSFVFSDALPEGSSTREVCVGIPILLVAGDSWKDCVAAFTPRPGNTLFVVPGDGPSTPPVEPTPSPAPTPPPTEPELGTLCSEVTDISVEYSAILENTTGVNGDLFYVFDDCSLSAPAAFLTPGQTSERPFYPGAVWRIRDISTLEWVGEVRLQAEDDGQVVAVGP